jgi:hypothetical protein
VPAHQERPAYRRDPRHPGLRHGGRGQGPGPRPDPGRRRLPDRARRTRGTARHRRRRAALPPRPAAGRAQRQAADPPGGSDHGDQRGRDLRRAGICGRHRYRADLRDRGRGCRGHARRAGQEGIRSTWPLRAHPARRPAGAHRPHRRPGARAGQRHSEHDALRAGVAGHAAGQHAAFRHLPPVPSPAVRQSR